MDQVFSDAPHREPWNKHELVGQKAPLKSREISAIRMRMEMTGRARDLALFDLAIDSKVRGSDLVALRGRDVSHDGRISSRAIVMQQKAHVPAQFKITAQTREASDRWVARAGLQSEDLLFPSRSRHSGHVSTPHYARIVKAWVSVTPGLDPTSYGTHSLRRTKASLICRRTKNLRAV